MVSHDLLAATARLYRTRARDDDRYTTPADVLDNALREFGLTATIDQVELRNSAQFIVLRTSGTTGEPKLLRHPMDFHELVIDAGIESLSRRGLLTTPRTCLIAISRGRLSGGFLFIYEVVRRCGWSILLLGASDDPDDVAELCTEFGVDTVFMAPNSIGAIFAPAMRGRFESVRNVLYIGEVPSPALSERLLRDFPDVQVDPFIYSTNDTGPLGIPTSEGSATTYEVPPNVLLEVDEDAGDVTLNGSGQILVSVLGLEDPKLIRWPIGDVGHLATSGAGRQTIELFGRGEVSVKFHLDSIGGSVILYKSVVMGFLRESGIHTELDVILRIRHVNHRTVVDVNLVSEGTSPLDSLEARFNSEFPVTQLRGRFYVKRITDAAARSISPGKRRFFIKDY